MRTLGITEASALFSATDATCLQNTLERSLCFELFVVVGRRPGCPKNHPVEFLTSQLTEKRAATAKDNWQRYGCKDMDVFRVVPDDKLVEENLVVETDV